MRRETSGFRVGATRAGPRARMRAAPETRAAGATEHVGDSTKVTTQLQPSLPAWGPRARPPHFRPRPPPREGASLVARSGPASAGRCGASASRSAWPRDRGHWNALSAARGPAAPRGARQRRGERTNDGHIRVGGRHRHLRTARSAAYSAHEHIMSRWVFSLGGISSSCKRPTPGHASRGQRHERFLIAVSHRRSPVPAR